MAILLLGTTVGGYAAIHAGNIGSQSVNYANTSGSTTGSATSLVSPNGATVIAGDSAMPAGAQSFIHTLAQGPGGNDGHILGMTWANASVYGAQIFLDTDPNDIMAIRSRSNAGVWTSWKTVLHSSNYNSYSPTLTGGGASGTWGINVTGNAQYFANNYIGTADANSIWRAGSYTFFNGVNVPVGDFGLISFPTWSSTDANSRYNLQLGSQIGGPLLYRSTNISGAASWATMLSDANYNSYSPTLTGTGASGTWGISISGNADTVDGYHVSVASSANTIPTRNASGYLVPENWIQLNGTYGLYSPTNGAHFYPNNGTYGAWKIEGVKNSYRGIEFGTGTNGNVTLMIHQNSNVTGFLNSAYDWQFYWSDGVFYVSKSTYGGGTLATVLDSINYSSYLSEYLLLTGGTLSGQLTFSSQGSKITFGDSTLGSPMMIGEGLVNSFGVDSDFMTIYARSSLRIFSTGTTERARFDANGLRVYGTIIKDGGTSSQFLKADGSVDSNTYVSSAALTAYLPLAGGTMSGNLVLKSISGTDQMVENTHGAYLHLGNWGVARLASDAILVNTAWRADALWDMNISQFTNNSGYITASSLTGYLPLAGGTLTGTLIGTTIRARGAQTNNNYTTAALWTESYDDTTTGIAFHVSGFVGKFLEMRPSGILYWDNDQVVTNSGTWSINVTGSAGSISGYNNPVVAATGSTIVYRDPSGHIYGYYGFYSYINTTDDVSTGTITHIIAKFGDNYHRSATAAKVQAFLGLGSNAYTSTSYLPLSGGTMTGIIAFSNVAGNKIDFYHAGTDRYGIQVQSSELRIHSGALGDAAGGITFGKSTTTTFTEHLRIRNDGAITANGSITAAGNIAAANYTGSHTGTSSGINTGDQTSVSGNAGTVTNGVYTNVTNTIVNGDATALIVYGGSTYNSAAALHLGGWSTDTTYARIRTSNGNLHIDTRGGAGNVYQMYFNHYSSGDMYFGNGGGTVYIYGGRLRHSNETPYIYNSGTWGISTTGNAATATYATSAGSADQIDGWGFVNTGSNTAINANTIDSNGISYYSSGVTNFSGNSTDGALYSHRYSTAWQHQIAGDFRSGMIAVRGKNDGTWQAWRTVLDSSNYVNYAWPLEGSWKPASLSAQTRLRGATSPDGGEFGLAYSGGQLYAYVDGFFYQNEGAYRVIDTNSVGSYAATPDHTHGLGRHSLAAPANIDGLTATNFRNTLFGSASNTWNISTARWNTTPTGLSGMNSYGTMLAWSGSDTHGFIAVDYSTANIQVGGGWGDNITWKATLIHSGNIGSQSVSLASQVTINYNNNSNATYQLLWGSGNSVYGTSGIYVNPNTDIIYSSGGYVSPGNAWGTNDSAFFPNGITTAGGDNWVYGHTYIAAAPSGGAGHEYWTDGSEYHKTTVSTVAHGQSGKWLTTQSAGGNYIPYSFEASNGDHSYGIIARFHIASNLGSDRPSIMFSNGYNSTRWNIGYCYADDQFRVTQNMGLAPNGTDGTWGSERFRIDTSGNTYAAIGGTLYANGSAVVTSANIGSQSVSYATTAGSAAYASNAGNADTVDGYSAVQLYNYVGGYLGGYYTSGGTEVPNSSIFGAGKLKLAMLSGTTLGFGGGWNDVLWLSAYSGGDVKSSHALVFDKYSSDVWVADQNFDSATWGTGYKLLSTANYTSYSPSLTGSGASGTWGINITGNSATTSQRSFSQDISTGGQGRFTGWHAGNAATGLAAEIGMSAGQAYVICYNRETAAYGTLNLESTNSNLRISGSTVNVTNGALQQGGNQVLHAANYNSYAPTLTGTGASGSWAISITGSAGSVAWDNITSRPVWMTNASLVGSQSNANSQVNSGFYENGGGGTNWPAGSATWYNSINVRHSNQGNYHGFQVAMSYYDNLLWFRSYQGTIGTFQTWAYAISSQNIGSQSVAYATDAGTLGTYANTTFVGKNGNTYYQVNDWLQFNGSYGLYWPGYYGAHLHANDLSNYTQLAIRGTKGGYSGIYDQNSGVHGIMYDAAGNGGIYRQASTRWYLYYNLGNSCMAINGTTTSSLYGMYVTGAIYSTGDIVAYSDVRKKTDIITIDSAISKVKEMRGVFYTRIDDEEKVRQVGVIAQEMNEVLPEAVTYASDIDEYGVKYGNIVGVLIEAIKEQQKEIDELKAKLN